MAHGGLPAAEARGGWHVAEARGGWHAAEACGGRVVSCMEGGYNLETLGETTRAHVRELQRTA